VVEMCDVQPIDVNQIGIHTITYFTASAERRRLIRSTVKTV
jgi:hypothetical protein